MDREKSAIDIIYELSDAIKILTAKLDVIDSNIKLLNNKIAKFSTQKNDSSQASESLNVKKAMPSASATELFGSNQSSQASRSSAAPQAQERSTFTAGPVKIFGHIVNKNRNPINGVVVNVFDESNKLLKTVKSDNNGYWEARMPYGNFGVEYIHKNFKPINRAISLKDGMKQFEVK